MFDLCLGRRDSQHGIPLSTARAAGSPVPERASKPTVVRMRRNHAYLDHCLFPTKGVAARSHD
jgi:hypothetical protein